MSNEEGIENSNYDDSCLEEDKIPTLGSGPMDT